MKHVLEEMWEALAAYQPQADKDGHGKYWAKMCKEKTSYAAYAAYSAAYAKAPTHAAALGASSAALAASYAADADVDADAQIWVQRAIDRLNKVIKPPQRKPLTEQQIVDLCDGTLTTWEQVRIARAIEAAHGIKE